ncbi:hypothetical protein MNBD_GAMMA22-3091 [hydrothermal vent metagenome]|uniref:Pvc16 N-terminal domain-containing protein n=1 Tax=hydrothermal vent metagenome TaxID=652676 RepID=A0A3B1B4M1_9ZZZZ
MIVEATTLVLAQLNKYIHRIDDSPLGTTDVVVYGNIAQLDNGAVSGELENKVVLTLINFSEEAALRNGQNYTRSSFDTVNYHNPDLYLNIVLLFSANYTNYSTALRRLSQVITFFQGQTKFTSSNSPGVLQNIPITSDISVTLDLLSLSFEEVNHLWGSLGGKQLPFSAYRARLIRVHSERILDAGGYISEIDVIAGDAVK